MLGHINYHLPDTDLAKSWLVSIVAFCIGYTPEYLLMIDVSLQHYTELFTLLCKAAGTAIFAINGAVTLYRMFKKPKNDAKQDN